MAGPKEKRPEDAPLSDNERRLSRRLLRWDNLDPDIKAALTDYVSVNGSLHVSSMPTLKGEEWREVGASGQPAFTNSWSSAGGSNAPPSFYKDVLGIIHLRGAATSPAGAGTGNTTAMFTLPEGYRPSASTQEIFPVRGASGATAYFGHVIVTSAGVVTCNLDGLAANAVVSNVGISGITFRAA